MGEETEQSLFLSTGYQAYYPKNVRDIKWFQLVPRESSLSYFPHIKYADASPTGKNIAGEQIIYLKRNFKLF